jgi:NADH-quinone oxidoreductase subunit G/NADP-reducing hydrogenase subunit HndD
VEHNHIKEVVNALNDPNKTVVVQHAPAISVSLAEEFGLKAGNDISGIMTSALRKIGFNRVFDTGFAADLTIMEEATELITRIKNGETLPMITSCSPAWIKFAETFYPEFLPNISTCKSPQQMLGAVIKKYWAEKENIKPENIFSVAVMPCTAKKFEAQRPEMSVNGVADIDAVLTTRELSKLIKMYGIDIHNLEPEINDIPFGTRSSAGKLFGGSGGVMEAALRTAHYLLTGKDLNKFKIQPVRGLDGVKEFKFKIGELELGGIVLSGLMNARKVLDEIKNGRNDIHFIEIMSCPGGCINGGGQPTGINKDNVAARLQALYNIDMVESVKASHKNKAVNDLYEEYLGSPNSEKAHELLHTYYTKREVLK